MTTKPQAACAIAMALLICAGARASTFQDLHDFAGMQSGDGDRPIAELVADGAGHYYGTTQFGGAFGFGTIFRLTLPTTKTGSATVDIVYSFNSDEGNDPKGGVLVGSDGALYGTTNIGGINNGGTVYRLSGGTLTTLHMFNPQASPPDGYNSIAGLTAGPNGLLYGTTPGGGSANGGTAFAISPQGDGVAYSVIHTFGAKAGDAKVPYFGRLIASGSKLFGTTSGGGSQNQGAAFQLQLPKGAAAWKELVIHSFAPDNGDVSGPMNGLTLGKNGVLYGCAGSGGHAQGAIYQLSPPVGGGKMWSESLLYSVGAVSGEPAVTECAMVLDKSGRLVGTSSGGGQNGDGTLFMLTPPATLPGSWTLQVLFSFGPSGTNAALQPLSAPLAVPQGYYAGTAYGGGTDGNGVIYRFKP